MLLKELPLVIVDDGERIFEVKVGKLAELVEENMELEEEVGIVELDEEEVEEELSLVLEAETDEFVVEVLGLSTITSTQLQNLSDLVSIVH